MAVNKIPRELSQGEETFDLHCRIKGLNPVREFKFCERGWRFDFAWTDPHLKLAVEIDGGTKAGKGRHSRGTGYEEDCRKMNRAAVDGWRVLRFTTAMVISGEAINEVLSTIGSTEPV